MLRRHQVHITRLRHRASRLARCIDEVVAQALGDVHEAPHDALIAPRFFLVQQSVLRLLVGELRTVARSAGRLAVRHPEQMLRSGKQLPTAK